MIKIFLSYNTMCLTPRRFTAFSYLTPLRFSTCQLANLPTFTCQLATFHFCHLSTCHLSLLPSFNLPPFTFAIFQLATFHFCHLSTCQILTPLRFATLPLCHFATLLLFAIFQLLTHLCCVLVGAPFLQR